MAKHQEFVSAQLLLEFKKFNQSQKQMSDSIEAIKKEFLQELMYEEAAHCKDIEKEIAQVKELFEAFDKKYL